MKNKLLGILMIVLAVAFIISAAQQGEQNTLIGGAALAALFIFLGIRFFRKSAPSKIKSTPAQKPAQSQNKYSFVNFSVAGVTFKNDDGSDRQTILRHLKFMDPPYVPVGDTDISVELTPYTWKGQPAYYCIANGYTIGSVPANKVQDVKAALQQPDAAITGFTVTGGGNGYNYGCDIAIRYTP